MKQFFRNYSYDMVKMFINQFAISIFGFVLVLAAGKAESVMLRNVTSVCAILFYLFLLYTMTWEIGYRDRISVEQGKKLRNPVRGLLISLCANSINFLFAIFITLAIFLDVPAISTIGAVSQACTSIFEGMYTGILVNSVGGAPLNSYWFMYFLIPLPAMLTCGLSYQLGIHDIKFTSVFDPVYPESDRDPKKKKDKDK